MNIYEEFGNAHNILSIIILKEITTYVITEQTLGDGEGQGSLACCSPWGHKELDTTEQLKTTHVKTNQVIYFNINYLCKNMENT